jgi:hypothetical protein
MKHTLRFSALRRKTLANVAIVTIVGAGAALSCGHESGSPETGVSRQALVTTRSFQQAVLPSAAYSGASDATLRESSPTNNDDTADICGIDGDNGGGVDKSCVIRWDVSEIPPGSAVTAASITFYLVDGGNQSYGIFELLRSWNAPEVTWTLARAGQAWATPGASGPTDRGAQLGSVAGATGSTQTVALNAAGVARVQAWINGPSSNAGVVVANTTNVEGIDLASSEHATASFRPKLTVTYDTGGGTGGSGGSGGSGTAGFPNLVVAFIGDQGNDDNAKDVLQLIHDEGAQAVVHNGDLDYHDNPSQWVLDIEQKLGTNFPYFAVLGNHEGALRDQYLQMLAARANRIPEMRDNCTGAHGYATSCNFRGIRVVQSCVGLGEVDSVHCVKDAPEPISHIHDSLANDASIWSVCNWHKVQKQMTVGDNEDEAGWQAYRECLSAGAIIVTAHNHTYSRSYTLTNFDAADKGKTGTAGAMQVGPGRTFVLVTGIGGRGLYSVKPAPGPEAWWASYYTDALWLPSGATQPVAQAGRQGAVFIKFNVDGDPRRAEGWVKNIALQTLDSFTIQAL